MTKTSLSRGIAIAAFLASAVPLLAQGQGGGPKTPLSQEMGAMSKDIRSLHKIITDPSQKNTAISLVKDMEDHATKAKGFDPAKTKEIPAADKDKFVADYKTQMDGLIADFQKLEAAINSGDTAGASALLDKLNTDKRDGHKKFNSGGGGPGGPGAWGGGPGGPSGGPGGPGAGGPPPQ